MPRQVARGATAPDELAGSFPPIDLPIAPPFPPMEATSATELPAGDGWQYEPKWDGFRCLAFKCGGTVLLQSKSGQPLARYFPDVVAALGALPAPRLVLDGEIVIVHAQRLDFDALLQRIHPAESRVRRLAHETPATLVAFDLLVDARGAAIADRPLEERRRRLEHAFESFGDAAVRPSPATRSRETADGWMQAGAAGGFDGVVAKALALPYRSGARDGMVKVKRLLTADCVVGGFRYAQKGGAIGSLLLGLYNDRGELDHVGFTSSFTAAERRALEPVVLPLCGGAGFSGRAPGGPSRWNPERSGEWQPLDPRLVCEVRFDHFSGGRFRHGTKFLRWRPDKAAHQCTFAQVRPAPAPRALALLGLRQ